MPFANRLLESFLLQLVKIHDDQASIEEDGSQILCNACVQFVGQTIRTESPPAKLPVTIELATQALIHAAVGDREGLLNAVAVIQTIRLIHLFKDHGTTRSEFIEAMTEQWDQES
jgi:hypothetical protein